MDFKTIITFPFLGARVVIDLLSSAVFGIIWCTRQWSYVRNLKYTFLNSMCRHDIAPLIINAVSTTTLDSYLLYTKSQKVKPDIVTFEDGSGGWIDSSKAKNILIHFHGGAYTNPATKIHMQILGDLVDAAQVQGKELGVFVVEYAFRQRQHTQQPSSRVLTCSTIFFKTTKIDPINVSWFSSEDHGTNFYSDFRLRWRKSRALLDFPSLAPSPKSTECRLKWKYSCWKLSLSPWVTFESSDSIKGNSKVDFIEQRLLIPQSQEFLGSPEEDDYNVPLKTSTKWWENLRVKDLYILTGDYEIFRDDIVELAKKIQVHNPNVEYYVEPAEVHLQALVDRGLKLGIAKSEDRFRNWVLSRL